MEINRRIKSKKLNTRVDLTAMVSVSFLLIIFFMLVGELSKPKIMALSMPDNGDISCGPIICFRENRIYTILLDDNNKIITYFGLLDFPLQKPKEFKYGKEGIRKELFYINKKVHQYYANIGKPKVGVTVIIKPSKQSNYGNLVDILDEMEIANIDSYSIVDYRTPKETTLLAEK
ncbi:biopolymer transport protein ExbD/TolR [Flavobacterium sp. 1]|uniref:ExbD/TolR family protein n=1 Tax=Flavobacterium sp. 1 TaxID=2035200 RepID=UPI000CBA1799|nr:biopolymer transport protein ExbD/TolR [Flavobacterium sp. 1]